MDDISGDGSSFSYGGVGFVCLLAIVFSTFKLTGYIAWSWIWVMAPIWISMVSVLLIPAALFVLFARRFFR